MVIEMDKEDLAQLIEFLYILQVERKGAVIERRYNYSLTDWKRFHELKYKKPETKEVIEERKKIYATYDKKKKWELNREISNIHLLEYKIDIKFGVYTPYIPVDRFF